MLPQLLNLPWPERGDLPEPVQREAAERIRQYWIVQIGLVIAGQVLVWWTGAAGRTIGAEVYLIPPMMNGLILALAYFRVHTPIWLVLMVVAFALQGVLIDGLGGLTAISFILPYTFAAMLLSRGQRLVVQAACVIAFWISLIYEIIPLFPQLDPRRLIFVSYNILMATLIFQTLRFLNRLAIELNTAHVAREVTVRSQQFLARVSHELRTPLNSVLGFAKLLRRTDLPEPGAAYLHQIVEEGEQLNKLVGDLLDSAHLATGKLVLTLAPCNINALCARVAEEIRPVMRPGVVLRAEWAANLPFVPADELRLRQIVRNLLGNAAKYTAMGTVTLRTALRNGQILITVEDTGPGIPAEEHEIVFVPFVKRDNRSAGVGLGLDIARQLARLHGGDISLQSEVGQGSIFTVSLPVP